MQFEIRYGGGNLVCEGCSVHGCWRVPHLKHPQPLPRIIVVGQCDDGDISSTQTLNKGRGEFTGVESNDGRTGNACLAGRDHFREFLAAPNYRNGSAQLLQTGHALAGGTSDGDYGDTHRAPALTTTAILASLDSASRRAGRVSSSTNTKTRADWVAPNAESASV
jgi:hypothetical protein